MTVPHEAGTLRFSMMDHVSRRRLGAETAPANHNWQPDARKKAVDSPMSTASVF